MCVWGHPILEQHLRSLNWQLCTCPALQTSSSSRRMTHQLQRAYRQQGPLHDATQASCCRPWGGGSSWGRLNICKQNR